MARDVSRCQNGAPYINYIGHLAECGEDEAPADSSSPETCEQSPQLTTSTLKKNTTR